MKPQDSATAPAQSNSDEDMPDMLLVNPGGRVVCVPGELGQKLLGENGYRKASEEEAKPYNDYAASIQPEVLRQKEQARVADEKKAAKAYLASAPEVSAPTPVAEQSEAAPEALAEDAAPRSRKSK